MPENIVIIGAGQAGAQAVASLRAEGFAGAITMVGDEPFMPYQRPPLSKAYLLGKFERERLFLKPESFYASSNARLLLNVAATAIDRAQKRVALSDGRTLDYDKLLLATGTRVRPILVPRADLTGIHYLRDHRRRGRVARCFPPRQAPCHRRRRLYRSGSGGGRDQARPRRHCVRSAGPVDGARCLTAVSAFYEQVHRERRR